MTKKKILFLIPFLLVAGFLLDCWTTILTSDFFALLRHYIGLLLFVVVTVVFFKDFTKAVVGLGVYLLLATFNGLAITPTIKTSSFFIGELSTPYIQPLSLGLLVLYFVLNLKNLIDIQLRYKEAKERKAKHRLVDAANTGLPK